MTRRGRRAALMNSREMKDRREIFFFGMGTDKPFHAVHKDAWKACPELSVRGHPWQGLWCALRAGIPHSFKTTEDPSG